MKLILLSFLALADSGTFFVKGMTCGGCVDAVKSAVCKLDGIEKCDVQVGSVTLSTKDGTKLDVDKISAAVKEAGYELAVAPNPSTPAKDATAKKKSK